MADSHLYLQVLTPTKKVLEKQADFVVLRCVGGDKGIFPGHESYMARLTDGMLRVYIDKELSDNLFVMGGAVLVKEDRVLVLSKMAGGAEEVRQALKMIEAQLEERRQEEIRSDVEIRRAEAALRNALVHMDVSSYTVLNANRDQYEQ